MKSADVYTLAEVVVMKSRDEAAKAMRLGIVLEAGRSYSCSTWISCFTRSYTQSDSGRSSLGEFDEEVAVAWKMGCCSSISTGESHSLKMTVDGSRQCQRY
jgi:hypothetical protein